MTNSSLGFGRMSSANPLCFSLKPLARMPRTSPQHTVPGRRDKYGLNLHDLAQDWTPEAWLFDQPQAGIFGAFILDRAGFSASVARC